LNTKNSIYRSLDIIEKRINEKLTVSNIAADVYISKFHYMRLFREVVGDSVMDYVNKRKLTLAANELLETNAQILDIAFEYGYDSREGFSRSFKAFMGVTPTEYRKYGKNRIANNRSKEYKNMKYTETINAVTQEIKEWVLSVKDTTNHIRQCSDYNTGTFWINAAEQTEILADSFTAVLEKLSSIENNPDEVVTGMDIVKYIDDTAFVVHSIAFQLELMEARTPDKDAKSSFTEEYKKLAWSGVEKAEKITKFFRELLLLVIADMRKTVSEKIQDAVKKGSAAAKSIPDDFYYIKDEIKQMVEKLSATPIEKITMQMLEDSFFKTRLITITGKLNIDAVNQEFFDKMQIFLDALNDTAGFCETIIKPVDDPDSAVKKIKVMQDIVYMENILFFYTNGEIEYLNREQTGHENKVHKTDFDEIKNKINMYKNLAFYAERDESDILVFQDLAAKVDEIISCLNNAAENLGVNGYAIKVIADELNRLTAKTMLIVNEIKEPESN